MGIHHIVSVSGGKDSACCYLLAIERRERTGKPFRAVFCDTQNEHEITYDYVRKLAERTGGPEIEWVRAQWPEKVWEKRRRNIKVKWARQGVDQTIIDRAISVMHPTGNVFLDMCLLRGGFPSPVRRYCTDYLKITPVVNQIYTPIWEAGGRIISWQGMRGEESRKRQGMKMFADLNFGKHKIKRYLPILRWSLDDVKAFHKRHGLPPNPLYLRGSTRVGCYPCINVSKSELRVIAERDPEHIERIAEWEYLVGHAAKTTGDATFLYARGISETRGADPAMVSELYGIKRRAKWAKTSRGGKQMELIPIDSLEAEFATGCEAWGVCEQTNDGWDEEVIVA